mmetsp:Transcript_119728/g.346054  ORF Transcript_119728/g.346054 Transcript_119728/m.346054 type:complete len:232 (-) Transcript_119728:1266-1961(-)
MPLRAVADDLLLPIPMLMNSILIPESHPTADLRLKATIIIHQLVAVDLLQAIMEDIILFQARLRTERVEVEVGTDRVQDILIQGTSTLLRIRIGKVKVIFQIPTPSMTTIFLRLHRLRPRKDQPNILQRLRWELLKSISPGPLSDRLQQPSTSSRGLRICNLLQTLEPLASVWTLLILLLVQVPFLPWERPTKTLEKRGSLLRWEETTWLLVVPILGSHLSFVVPKTSPLH